MSLILTDIIWDGMLRVAGQTVSHVHLHIIPRFKDEPFAGKGIRHWLKKSENKRPQNLK